MKVFIIGGKAYKELVGRIEKIERTLARDGAPCPAAIPDKRHLISSAVTRSRGECRSTVFNPVAG